MALQIHTVIVFGDSLSDIGKKWTTGIGLFGRLAQQIRVNATGRFSDCRNWTDHMFEEATGRTMISGTDNETVKISGKFTSYNQDSIVGINAAQTWPGQEPSRDEALGPDQAPPLNESAADRLNRAEADFVKSKAAKAKPKDSRKRGGVLEVLQYANYAEGGACGRKPTGGHRFVLGTFRDQVDAFEKDRKSSKRPLGNTLFIVWFGGNDVYTVNRDPNDMPAVAVEIATTQRQRLVEIFGKHKGSGSRECKFIFADLARPLTMARYQNRLSGLGMKDPKKFREQVEEIERLERSVRRFNDTLKGVVSSNGDTLAELGRYITEETLAEVLLKPGTYELKTGAKPLSLSKVLGPGAKFVAANDYGGSVKHVACSDELHPTDPVYRMIWAEIREKILDSGCTFGNLTPGDHKASPLAALAAITNSQRSEATA